MLTYKIVKTYLEALHKAQPVYCWGADMQLLTPEFIENQKRKYGVYHYENKDWSKYYGYLGCDCSGLLTNISGKDMTAQQYYNGCKEKGVIKDMPTDTMCLIFRGAKTNITHVGIYLPNKKTYEMYNRLDIKNFDATKWNFFGLPDFFETTYKMYHLEKAANKYYTSNDAKHQVNKKGKLEAGYYYIFSVKENNIINLSTKPNIAGSWVNLN